MAIYFAIRGKIAWFWMIGKDLVFALVLMAVKYALTTDAVQAERYKTLGGVLFATIIAVTSTHLAVGWKGRWWR